jgi:ubiquinone/menaquinone biosynthesis C-methylase UbiE
VSSRVAAASCFTHDYFVAYDLPCSHFVSRLRCLPAAARPVSDASKRPRLEFVEGNAERLPFPSNSVDLYTIAFGIRNVTNVAAALSEAHRVLKPGGRFMCLEFSHLPNPVAQQLYDLVGCHGLPFKATAVSCTVLHLLQLLNWPSVKPAAQIAPRLFHAPLPLLLQYSFNVIPLLGEVVMRDRAAYQYLVESIRKFPDQRAFAAMLKDAGFRGVSFTDFTLGVAAVHSGFKLPPLVAAQQPTEAPQTQPGLRAASAAEGGAPKQQGD